MKKKLIQKAIDNLFLHEIWMGNSNINVFKHIFQVMKMAL